MEPTVLLVDDDPGVLNSLRWLLESEGLEVESFQSAQQFLDEYDPKKPGCVVLDVKMPEMDGLELQERMGMQGDHRPIIFVTGHGDVPTSVRAMRAGAVDFLEKPVDDDTLLERVSQAVARDLQRRRREMEKQEIQLRIDKLSPREHEVMQLLYDGKANKQVAAKLGISIQTAAKHRTRVLAKMGVQNDTELIRLLHRVAKERVRNIRMLKGFSTTDKR
jgi:RNA polymerase sigma factor (sigma-70 family)